MITCIYAAFIEVPVCCETSTEMVGLFESEQQAEDYLQTKFASIHKAKRSSIVFYEIDATGPTAGEAKHKVGKTVSGNLFLFCHGTPAHECRWDGSRQLPQCKFAQVILPRVTK